MSENVCRRRLGVVRNREIRAAIYSPSLRPHDSVQGLDRMIWTLIFSGNKAIEHKECDSWKARESLHTIPEKNLFDRFVILDILDVKHCKNRKY